jgi:hypothetical protein
MKTANTEIVKNNANNRYYSLNIQKNPTKVTEQALLGVPQKLYARVISGYWKLFPRLLIHYTGLKRGYRFTLATQYWRLKRFPTVPLGYVASWDVG